MSKKRFLTKEEEQLLRQSYRRKNTSEKLEFILEKTTDLDTYDRAVLMN
jgi:hypothetical protein